MTAPKTTAPRRRRTTPKIAPAIVELPTGGEAGDATQPGSSDAVTDLEAILPDPTNLTVLGIPAKVNRLQTREIMTGIRLLVAEMGESITSLDIGALMTSDDDVEGDDEEAQERRAELARKRDEQKQNLFSFLLVAAPGMIDELLKLFSGLVEARNSDQAQTLTAIMYNPPPAVVLDVMGVIWAQEQADLRALMGKAQQLLGYAQALQRTKKAGT